MVIRKDAADRVDVVVVGGGGSGLAAALSVVQSGGRVVLLEKQPRIGGTTAIAIGSFTAAGTDLQRHAQITDDPAAHDQDAGKFGPAQHQAKNNTALRQYFLCHAAETLQWLAAMGLAFHGPSPEPPNRVARMHNVVPNAKAYIAALRQQLLRGGGRIVTDADVQCVQMDSGRATGVEAVVAGVVQSFNASRAVVLAAGDYANCPELIRQHIGPQYENIEGINPHATGDGQRLAKAAGAKLINMEIAYGPELRFVAPPRRPWEQRLPTSGPVAKLMGAALPWIPGAMLRPIIKRMLVTWQHPEDALFDAGAILLNRGGQRFTDETAPDQREVAVSRQEGKQAFILLDATLIDRFSQWPNFISTAPEIAYAYVKDYLRLRPDICRARNSLEQLALDFQMPVDSVTQTVSSVNALSASGGTDPFGRRSLVNLSGSRWVMLGPVKAYFTTTEGGAAINQQMQVLDEQGNAIDGLFAVGQNGLGGQVLWGHGLHIAWALTSGRLAGKAIMHSQD